MNTGNGSKVSNVAIGLVVLISLGFNLAFINWGLPDLWHPDEVTKISVRLLYNQTLNPRFFEYPSLQIYLVYFLAVLPYSLINQAAVTELLAIPPGQSFSALQYIQSEVTLHARVLTAVMGTATVYLTYRSGRELFGRLAGLIAAALLALSAGFIGLAHFATVDVPATFWMSLSFYLVIIAFSGEQASRYLLAAFVIGLAISTKYTAVLLVPTLFAARFLDPSSGRISLKWPGHGPALKTSAALAALIALGFFLGTPFALLDPLEFLKDFLQLQFYQPTYGGSEQRGYVPHVLNLLSLTGAFGFIAILAGLAYATVQFARDRSPLLFLLLLTIVIYYLKMGNMMFHPARYILPVLPFLLLLAGRLLAEFLGRASSSRPAHLAVIALMSAGFVFSAYYATMGVARIANDSRLRAQEWVLANVDRHESIEVSGGWYGVSIPSDYSHFSRIPYYHEKPTMISLNESPLYRKLSAIYVSIKGGKGVRNTRAVQAGSVLEPAEVSLESLINRGPRYLVLSKMSYERFIESTDAMKFFPLQNRLYTSVLSESTPYKLVADFEREESWLRPELEFIDTGVKIFELQTPSG